MNATMQGVPELIAKMQRLGQTGVVMSKTIVSSVADLIVADAKDAAPADLGTIRQQLNQVTRQQAFSVIAIISSPAPESAFQEFGTGGKVDVPEEMADIASQFQGASGGDMAAFILALTDWVKRHGLTGVYSVKTQRRNNNYTNQDEQTAWAIAKAILRDGLKPQPFLYPAYVKNSVLLLPMLQNGFQQLLKNAQSN